MGFKVMQDGIRVETVNGRLIEKKVKVAREAACKKCGAPTRSHYYDDGTFMCHKCWLKEEEKKKQAENPHPNGCTDATCQFCHPELYDDVDKIGGETNGNNEDAKKP